MRRFALAFVLLLCNLVCSANAGLFKHEWTGVGSGTFDGTAFTDMPFSIQYVIDSDDVYASTVPNSSEIYVPRSETSIDLEHFGVFTFKQMLVWVNQGNATMGFADDLMGRDLYRAHSSPAIAGWDMTSEISITGDFWLLQWNSGAPIGESGSTKWLDFDDDLSVAGTFTATAIPEPSSFLMVGLTCVLCLTFRRKYRTA